MKRFTFLPRVILGLLLFVTGGGISLAADTYVTNTVNGTTYTFTVTSTNTKDKTANVSLSKIGGTDLAKYTASTDIDLAAAYPNGTFTVDGTTYTITSMAAMGGTSIATVKMPSTVTSLPKYCFNGCTSLTTVSIPGIQTIGEAAFSDCTSLSGELTIPKGASVAYRAFDGCSGITSIVLHSSMTSGADWSGNGCFMSMSGVKSVSIIDDGNNTIPANVFGGASFSKDGVTLKIDNTITAIGAYAFKSANFPKNLDLSQFTSFGSHAFDGNTTITGNNGVTFAENTQFSGEQTFVNCTGLSGTLTIPNGANISYRAFDGCKGITSIVLHSGMTSREYNRNGCFMTMSGVTSVSIKDDGNHTIPANVFGHASFSTDGVSLNIDNTITGIGDYAFNHANFPTTLDLSSQFTSYGISAFEDNKVFKGNENGVIAVKTPSGASGVTVGSKAFWNTQATEIDIDPNMVYSGCAPTDAYYSNGAGPYNGTSITKIVFESSITSIPDYLFLHASGIPSTCTVTWPTKPITHIGKGAFCGVQFTAAIPKKNVRGRDDWRICLCT